MIYDDSPFADAIAIIDRFLRAIREHPNPSHLATSPDLIFEVNLSLESTRRALDETSAPPDPLRSNYVARLQSLAFELHRLELLLRQESERLHKTLQQTDSRRHWLATLSKTQ